MPATDLFPLDPDYTLTNRIDAGVVRKKGEDGSIKQRSKKGEQLIFELVYLARDLADTDLIRDFYASFRADWFKLTIKDYEDNAGAPADRSFAVTFLQEPEYEYAGPFAWNIRVTLIEDLGNTV